jgi:hypothetical protein
VASDRDAFFVLGAPHVITRVAARPLACILYCLLSCPAPATADAATLQRAYVDGKHDVRIVTARGRHVRLTRKGNVESATLAPDNETVAWLVKNGWTEGSDALPGPERLFIYRNGKTTMIECEQFIRGYWFWARGRQVVIDCGGLHFAGNEILYDARTGKVIDHFYQGDVSIEQRPPWADGGN